jgi:hypothetical protein
VRVERAYIYMKDRPKVGPNYDLTNDRSPCVFRSDGVFPAVALLTGGFLVHVLFNRRSQSRETAVG